MAMYTKSRLVPLLRQLHKQAPALMKEQRCMGSASNTAPTLNTSFCVTSDNTTSIIHHQTSRTSLGTDSFKHCTVLDETCMELNSLSVNVDNETLKLQRPRIHDIFKHCLPITNKEIRDNPRVPDLKYELPKLPGLCLEITTPTCNKQVTSLDTPGTNQILKITPGIEQPMKYANSTSLKMKHRRMKKHKLRRLRQRYWAEFRKKRFQKEARKKRRFEAELAAVRKEGADFDAETFVKDKLGRAKQGGYMINILETSERGKSL